MDSQVKERPISPNFYKRWSDVIRKKVLIDLGKRKKKVAESWGFEPQIPFWGILA